MQSLRDHEIHLANFTRFLLGQQPGSIKSVHKLFGEILFREDFHKIYNIIA